jgi:homospermidine synthase
MCWAILNPNAGIVEPDEMDHEFVLDIAKPYLGKLAGYFTQWTPYEDKGLSRQVYDPNDPWQFINIHVA